MRNWLLMAAIGLLLAGCSVSAKSSKASIEVNQIPAAVQGAFDSEHPYAQINDPIRISNQDGSVSYQIPYTRPDGTKGTATYAPTGELQNDK
jgi:hypothetical protein